MSGHKKWSEIRSQTNQFNYSEKLRQIAIDDEDWVLEAADELDFVSDELQNWKATAKTLAHMLSRLDGGFSADHFLVEAYEASINLTKDLSDD